jgi:Zn-dependent M28 family amino/carboxypeptidase
MSSRFLSLAAGALLLATGPVLSSQTVHPAASRPPVARTPAPAHTTDSFDGARALKYAADFVAIGPRWPTSPGHAKAEDFLKKQFAAEAAKGQLEADHFTPTTPIGPVPMTNYIVRFPGKKDGVIVLASHYETNYPLRNIGFVGANDGGSTVGTLIEMANHLRGKTLDGYSVWLVFFDGEEAFQQWSASDSDYGSRHLAAKWQSDGTLKRVKAFILLDMIGDKELDIVRDLNSTPWLLDTVKQAAAKFGYQKYFYVGENSIEDDQLPFKARGVPVDDIIDFDYGPHDSSHPDGYHHTAEDTMDKISAKSLTIIGNTVIETMRLLNVSH